MRKLADIFGLLIFILGCGALVLGTIGDQLGLDTRLFLWIALVFIVTGLSISRTATRKDCPACGERIKLKATKCKHCGTDIPSYTNAPRVAH